jgi:hypothetical protein
MNRWCREGQNILVDSSYRRFWKEEQAEESLGTAKEDNLSVRIRLSIKEDDENVR